MHISLQQQRQVTLSLESNDTFNKHKMSGAKMEEMPQMPETHGFLEIFQQLLGFDLISSEWASGLSLVAIALIIITCLFIVGGAALASWYNYTTNEDGILRSVGEKIKEVFGSKQD